MNYLADLWQIIVQTNTFNFAILVLILAIIFVKLDFGKVIEKIKTDIIDAIETAKFERENAGKELNAAKEKVKNLEAEVQDKMNTAKKNAQLLAKQILNDTKNKILQIEKNAKKVIEAEERNLSSKLTSSAVESSVELAKQHIKKMLDENPELHNKYIDKSLNEIDKVNF